MSICEIVSKTYPSNVTETKDLVFKFRIFSDARTFNIPSRKVGLTVNEMEFG